jgi:hypothetical protein
MKTKLFHLLLMTIILLTSCNSSSNIKKEDICGKRFTSSTPVSSDSDYSNDTGTTLNCDGTFESGEVTRGDQTRENSVDRSHFTGTWQLIDEIPDNVKQTVIKFGVKNDDYSIIKYSSSNGVSGYCLCYMISGTYKLEPLFTGQISLYDWGNVSGATGIFGGSLAN